jgi:hypothetical protein
MRSTFVCPVCQQRVRAPAARAGESGPCPTCGSDVERWPDPIADAAAPRTAEEIQWFCHCAGERHGPMTEAQLRAMADGGRLRPSDLVWHDGWAEWKEAAHVEELFPGAKPTLAGRPAERDDDAPPRQRRRYRDEADPDADGYGREPRARTWPIVAFGAGCVVVLVLVFGFAVAELQGRGKRLEFNRGEVFYTTRATRDEATRLGNYLVRDGYFDGTPKSVQLTRDGRRVQVRLVVKKGTDTDPQFAGVFREFAAQINREVFTGQQFELHLCDEYLKTLRVIPGAI